MTRMESRFGQVPTRTLTSVRGGSWKWGYRKRGCKWVKSLAKPCPARLRTMDRDRWMGLRLEAVGEDPGLNGLLQGRPARQPHTSCFVWGKLRSIHNTCGRIFNSFGGEMNCL